MIVKGKEWISLDSLDEIQNNPLQIMILLMTTTLMVKIHFSYLELKKMCNVSIEFHIICVL